MNKIILLHFAGLLICFNAKAQNISLSDILINNIDSEIGQTIILGLDTLFGSEKSHQFNRQMIVDRYEDLSISVLSSIKKTYHMKVDSGDRISLQMDNLIPIDADRYLLMVSMKSVNSACKPQIEMIFQLIAELKSEEVQFSIPLAHHTRHWNSTKVGHITYSTPDKINMKNAKYFDSKNVVITNKLRVPVESFEFFLCDNFQEILNLLGIVYDADEAGKYRDGYGVVAGCIFSIMNNEDFSHDIFHYYSSKVNKRSDRNWVTEEGVAYSWGNAYYTDMQGEMIEQPRLAHALRRYMELNPEVSYLHLFEKDLKIFNDLAPEASVRSTISSLICDEVERTMGMEGLGQLINCGSKNRLEAYFKSIDRLLGINRANFDDKIELLIKQYKIQK